MFAMMDFLKDNASAVKYFSLISKNRLFRSELASVIEEKFTEIVMFEMGITELNDYLKYFIESNFSYPKTEILDLIKEIDERCDPLYHK